MDCRPPATSGEWGYGRRERETVGLLPTCQVRVLCSHGGKAVHFESYGVYGAVCIRLLFFGVGKININISFKPQNVTKMPKVQKNVDKGKEMW